MMTSQNFHAHLPVVELVRYIGAQDELNGSSQKLWIDGQVTKITLRWDLIEKEKGNYNWNAEYNDAAIFLADNKKLIIGTRASPVWSRKHPDFTCSQPKPEFYKSYANFLVAAIDRYKPWSVELWNEPEVRIGTFENSWFFMGCWDSGKEYSAMTKIVYPIIKEKHPKVLVMVGALIMEDRQWLKDFFKTKPKGDIVSYHAYDYWKGETGNVKRHANWLSDHTDKPLFLSETSLLDASSKCSNEFQLAKAKFLDDLNKTFQGLGIVGFTWYTIGNNNWKCSDLYPGPAYERYKNLFP